MFASFGACACYVKIRYISSSDSKSDSKSDEAYLFEVASGGSVNEDETSTWLNSAELVNIHRDEHKTLRRKVMGDEPVELGTQTELQNEHDMKLT